MLPPLSIGILHPPASVAQRLQQSLEQPVGENTTEQLYTLHWFATIDELIHFLQQDQHYIDCLLLTHEPALPQLCQQLQQQTILLPTVLLSASEKTTPEIPVYHKAVQPLPLDRLVDIGWAIAQAIRQFLQLAPHLTAASGVQPKEELPDPRSISQQQQRLTEKLKTRLGYLGIYYKRDPTYFLRHMTQAEKQELLTRMRLEYREIVLLYFSNEPQLNDMIDNFVNLAFFADVPVSQIVEIHMELMDEFSKQLKLEGRSDEVLLDYRLTLIDTIAHLCEMYRRAIPRES